MSIGRKWISSLLMRPGNASIQPASTGREMMVPTEKTPISKWYYRYIGKYGTPLFGLGYIAGALFCSIKFWMACQISLANDMIWAGYNATGTGYYIGALYNSKINVDFHGSERFDLTDPMFNSFEDLSKTGNQIRFYPTYARFVKYNHLTDLHVIVKSLQHDGKFNPYLFYDGFTQYCWVDFERRWSIAHTSKREKRCLEKDKENSAVYLEAYLRTIKWEVFDTTWGEWFQSVIGNAISKTKEGQIFLESIKDPGLSLEEEVKYWKKMGLTYHQTQWHTNYETGIFQTLSIENVLGMKQNITTKSMPYKDNWDNSVTNKMHWGILNDWLLFMDTHYIPISGMSMVRNDPDFYENYNVSIEEVMLQDQVVPFPLTPKDQLLRDTLGPFGSIDMRPISYPGSFDRLYDHYRRLLFKILRSKNSTEARKAFEQIPDRSGFFFIPSQWYQLENQQNTTITFLGGSPLCSNEIPLPYVTQMFHFDTNCDYLIQQSSLISRMTSLFAYLANSLIYQSDEILLIDQAKEICIVAVDDTTLNACIEILIACNNFYQHFMTAKEKSDMTELVLATFNDLTSKKIELMQYAKKTKGSTNTEETLLLRHPLLISKQDGVKYTKEYAQAWNFFGWVYSHEWFIGKREVVSFEGDEGTMVLISGLYGYTTISNSKDENLPSNMSSYMLWIVQYITLVLIGVATVVLFYAIGNKLNIEGLNLLEFDRVAGAVWIGRPLLTLRGLVAISMLSNGHLILVKDGNLSYLTETTSNWFQNIITASEACWITYVLNDILKICTQGYTRQLAKRSSQLAWVMVAILQLVAPISHRATFELKCEYTSYEGSIVCSTGNIQNGNLTRFVLIILMSIGSVVICFLFILCTKKKTTTTITTTAKNPSGCTLLLPGIAQEIFENSNWLHQEEWHLDTASALIAGLLTIRYRQWSLVLDVKTWSLLHVRNGLVVEYADDHALSPEEEEKYFATRPLKLQHTLRLAGLKKFEKRNI